MKLTGVSPKNKLLLSQGAATEKHDPASQEPISSKGRPVVSVTLDGGLVEVGDESDSVWEPVPGAFWALQVFNHNGWEVEVTVCQLNLNRAFHWIHEQVPGLVGQVHSSQSGSQSLVDVFINSRSEYWIGRKINWVEVMERLHTKGFLPLGLLPRDKTMMHLLEDVNFRDYISDVHADIRSGSENGDTLQKIETYSQAAIEADSGTVDRIQKALVGGKLLHNVLVLLAKQKFDPLGCLLLAQQQDENLG